MRKLMYCAFYLCILFVTGVVGVIIERPLNAAMAVGDQTTISCSSNTTGDITWTHTSVCNSAEGILLTTDNDCNISSSQTTHYRTEKPGEFVCNLVVFDALLNHGGCYVCSDGSGPGRLYSAFLIVVDSISTIATNATELLSGEYVTISNTVSYGGPMLQPPLSPPLPPSFYWTMQSDPSHNITSNTGTPTANSTSSNIVVEVQKPYVLPFVCNLFFITPVNVPPGCANNTPTYRTSWITPTYNVSYPPENVSVSEITIACPYEKSVFITCNASGFPIPTYEWFDLTHGGDPTKGSTLQVDRGGIFQCVASNTIRNEIKRSESLPVNVSDCFTYTIDTNQPPACDTPCIVILVVAIYFGLNLLFFVIFIICYGCYENGQKTLNGQFPWLIKMLPCLNEKGCKCSVWIFYFVILSIFAAFIFFPVIMIMASCCKKEAKKTSQANPLQSERNGRGAGGTQLNTFTTTPTYQQPGRMSVTPNPPSPLNTSGHFPQDQLNRPYPHSSNQQRQPESWGNSDHYPQNHRNPRPPPRPSPSPLSTGGIVYAELGVDNHPMSRRPIQPIQDGSNNYADIALA